LLEPEQNTSAIVVHHPGAKVFCGLNGSAIKLSGNQAEKHPQNTLQSGIYMFDWFAKSVQ